MLVLSFKEAVKQEWQQFDISHKHEHQISETSSLNEADRKLSEEIVIQKAIHICDKQISRLKKGFFNSGSADQKIRIFESYRQRIQQKNGEPKNNKLEVNERITLGKYRFFERKGKTESIQKIEKIEALINSYTVNSNQLILNGHARHF